MKVDEYQASSIISWYEELEERLIEFLKFLPFTSNNLNVFSPRLAGVVTETCHILDSLFREVAKATETINGKNVKKKDLHIAPYGRTFQRQPLNQGPARGALEAYVPRLITSPSS